MSKLIKEIMDALNAAQKNKTEPYDRQGEVKRIEGKIAWVKLEGSDRETPIQMTIACDVGDTVQARIGGGSAWLTGNLTAPPTDDKKANQAISMVTNVVQEIQETVDEALEDIASVEDVTVQYCLSTSSSTFIQDGDWSNTPPAYQANRYYWTRSVIEDEDGNVTYGTPQYSQDTQLSVETSRAYATTDAHFWYDSTGAYVTNATKTDYKSSASNKYATRVTPTGILQSYSGNLLSSWTNSGISFYQGDSDNTPTASFGSGGAEIYSGGTKSLGITNDAVSFYDTYGTNVGNIFNILMEKQSIHEDELIKILEEDNKYLIGVDIEGSKEANDIKDMVEAINSAYKIGKLNFIWTSKLKEEKQNMENQLNGVSRAILDIAEDMKNDNADNSEYLQEAEQISQLFKQKDMLLQDISIKKNSSDRFIIELYIEENKVKDIDKIIENTLTKVLNEKIIITTEEDLKFEKMTKYTCMADDRYLISIGQAGAVKDHKDISGDSVLKIRLKDGKYLIVISDGMGSGPEARKSSQIVIKMLQRLLNSGFEKNTSIDLINSSLLNVSEDVFATLDIAIVDLYKGNVEFIKSGACPTYIKNGKKIQIIKSLALPAGILKDITGEIFDKDIENEEIMVMCTDGIIDSNVEYKNKELWVKYLLEDMENNNPQKIADIVLNEAIDNNFGKIKDDMSVVVCKFVHK